MTMNRRQFLVRASSTAVVVLAGCSGDRVPNTGADGSDNGDPPPTRTNMPAGTMDGSDPQSALETSGPTDAPPESLTPPMMPSPSTSFSGSGEQVTDSIDLDGGLLIVEATYSGSGDFLIRLRPEEGEYKPLVINASGDYDGATAQLIDAGTYQVEVTAESEWDVTVRQPRPDSGDPLPQSLDGDGPGVFGPFVFSKSSHTATGTHDNSGEFVVEVVPVEGLASSVVFYEIGEFEGETSFYPPDLGYVDVSAGGSWTLEMESATQD